MDPCYHARDPRTSARQSLSRAQSRYVAEHRTRLEIAAGHLPWSKVRVLSDEIEGFLTGSHSHPGLERVLTTVLFTDIVGSTDRAARIGDRAWGEVKRRHHDIVRLEIDRFRGHERDTAGDGFFATFDGPARAVRCAKAIEERGIGRGQANDLTSTTVARTARRRRPRSRPRPLSGR